MNSQRLSCRLNGLQSCVPIARKELRDVSRIHMHAASKLSLRHLAFFQSLPKISDEISLKIDHLIDFLRKCIHARSLQKSKQSARSAVVGKSFAFDRGATVVWEESKSDVPKTHRICVVFARRRRTGPSALLFPKYPQVESGRV